MEVKLKKKYASLTDFKTYRRDVDYWMKFIVHRGIGFHDAGWREEWQFKDINRYKNNGSLGCVNMRPTDAKALYNLFTYNINVYVVK